MGISRGVVFITPTRCWGEVLIGYWGDVLLLTFMNPEYCKGSFFKKGTNELTPNDSTVKISPAVAPSFGQQEEGARGSLNVRVSFHFVH